MEKARKKLLAAAALAAAGAATTAVVAVTGIPGSALADPVQHCVQNVNTGEQRCFADFGEAVAFATQGQVTGVPNDAPAAVNSGALRAQLDAAPSIKAAGDIIQGTVFENADYGGSSLTIVGPALCEKDGVVNWQYDLTDDWKNRITSVQAWGNCWLWLYPEPGLNGDRDGPFKENTPNIGDFMNDRTQSIGFS